jgi:hypothetical protein
VPDNPPLPSFTSWPSFPFEGDLRVKTLDEPVALEPVRKGDDASDCVACNTPDEAYIWVSERWRVRAMDRPTGLPMVLILESRSHLDLGDLPNLLAAELGVMTVRLERAIRSIDGVARVHVNRWGDGAAHLHLWFMARPYGRLQLRGTFLPLWDEILPPISESVWRENLALIAAWLAEFGGRPLAEPPHIEWKAPSSFAAAAEARQAEAQSESLREVETTVPLEGPDEAELEAEPESKPEPEPKAAAGAAPNGAKTEATPDPAAAVTEAEDKAGADETVGAIEANHPDGPPPTASVAGVPANAKPERVGAADAEV